MTVPFYEATTTMFHTILAITTRDTTRTLTAAALSADSAGEQQHAGGRGSGNRDELKPCALVGVDGYQLLRAGDLQPRVRQPVGEHEELLRVLLVDDAEVEPLDVPLDIGVTLVGPELEPRLSASARAAAAPAARQSTARSRARTRAPRSAARRALARSRRRSARPRAARPTAGPWPSPA